jgi:hypothetical protein
MTLPAQFILSSDFPTLKNDASSSGSIVIPTSFVIAGNGSYTNSSDVTIGAQGAMVRGRIASSKNSSLWWTGQIVTFNRTGTVLGFPSGYTLYCSMYKTSATTLRFSVYIRNESVDPLTTEAGAETVSFYANTFAPLFD